MEIHRAGSDSRTIMIQLGSHPGQRAVQPPNPDVFSPAKSKLRTVGIAEGNVVLNAPPNEWTHHNCALA